MTAAIGRTTLLARTPWLATAVALAAISGCQFDQTFPTDTIEAAPTVAYPGAGVGAACSTTSDCREGLSCTSQHCRPAGTVPRDGKCLMDAECASGLSCGWAGLCEPSGVGAAGTPCTSAADCGAGLFCETAALSGFCRAPSGSGDLGASCTGRADCLSGLACSAISKTCVPGSLLLNPDVYEGVDCPSEATLPFGGRTVVPRAGVKSAFYDMPFPTDVRMAWAHLNLSDHPVPGPGLLGADPVATLVQLIGQELDGFGLYPAVSLRFTRSLAPSTLDDTGAGASVLLIDLDTGTTVASRAVFVDARNKYACGNRLVVRPRPGTLLRPATRYAVVVRTTVRTPADDGAVGQDVPQPLDDLPALLSATAPADLALKPAWDTYEPLRGWLAKSSLDASTVAAATVFTTRLPGPVLDLVLAAVDSAPAPGLVADSVVTCGGGVHSPCATPGWASTDAGKQGLPDPRDCPAVAAAGFREIHAKVGLPAFQEGTAPYLAGGGAIHLVDGKPVATRTEEVCVGFAVPDGAAPGAGWPLVIYAHGTGGTFRTGLQAHGARMAALGIALVGFDMPLHGPRQGGGQLDPGPLVYNYANAPACKGNFYQGAADIRSLVRMAQGFHGPLGAAGTVGFDPAHLVVYGHSQGGTTGGLAVPGLKTLAAAILSGVGGDLTQGLLGKKLPRDASAGVRLALQEVSLDENHPVLALFNLYFEDTDPMIRVATTFAPGGVATTNLLTVMGWDDTYNPWQTSLLFAAQTRGPLVEHLAAPAGNDHLGWDPAADLGLSVVSGADLALAPIQGNAIGAAGKLSVATVADVSDGTYDGHFVGEDNPWVVGVVGEFLASLLQGSGAPKIAPGAP